MGYSAIDSPRNGLEAFLPLSRQVYDNLHDRIVALDLKPFAKLSEKLIAADLGVSRTPVREALARLADQRLVDILPQRGTMVSPMRFEDLKESQFMREAIELALLRHAFAAEKRDLLVQRLRNEIRLQRAFLEVGEIARFYQSDEAFHWAIADHAQMPKIAKEIDRAKIHMDRFRRVMIAGVDNLERVIDQHTAIVDAIEIGDFGASERLMLSHLRRVLVNVDKAVALFPHFFEDPESAHQVKLG